MKQIILYALVLSSTMTGYAQDSWQLKKNRNDVRIYTRDYPDSKFKEYKAEMVVANTTLETVKHIILDADNLKNWNYQTSKSKLLRKIDDNNYIFYLFNDMPWPVLNRDHVSDVVVSYPNKKSVLIAITPNNNVIPENKGIVRIKDFKGHWLLQETEKGIYIMQQLYGDPEGGVPSWLVNSQLVKSPYTSFNNLRELLKNNPN